jgi:hypothetical protein
MEEEEEEEEEYAWNFLVREQYLQWCNLFHALFLIFFRFLQKVMNIINIIASWFYVLWGSLLKYSKEPSELQRTARLLRYHFKRV